MRSLFLFSFLFTMYTSISSAQEISDFSIADFRSGLRKGMTKQEVAEKYGEPGKDIRYGLLNYVYILADSSEIEIGFTDGLLYATHKKEIEIIEEIVKDIEVELTLKFIEDNLIQEMGVNMIRNTFGKPDDDIGSGIYIFLYTLSDSSSVIIGSNGEKVMYAHHLNRHGDKSNLLE